MFRITSTTFAVRSRLWLLLVPLAAVAAMLVGASAPAHAEPACPPGNTTRVCPGSEPTPTSTPAPQPPQPGAPAEPDILIQMAPCTDAMVDKINADVGEVPQLPANLHADAIAKLKKALPDELVNSIQTAVSSHLPNASIRTVCANGRQSIGVWSTAVSQAHANAHLPSQQRLQHGETYAIRVSERFLAAQVTKGLQDPKVRAKLDGNGLKTRYARVATSLSGSATLKVGLLKPVLGAFSAEADISAVDTVIVRDDGSLGCKSETFVDTNAIADIAEFANNFLAGLELRDHIDVQGEARSAVSVLRPGCLIASLTPRSFLRAPVPDTVPEPMATEVRNRLPQLAKIRFDASRAQGLNGPFEIAGRWDWSAREPKVTVDAPKRAGDVSSVTLPLRLHLTDLRGPVHVEIRQGGRVAASKHLEAAEMEKPEGIQLPATFDFLRKPNLLPSVGYKVVVRDADGYVAERSASWTETEPSHIFCAQNKHNCPVTRWDPTETE